MLDTICDVMKFAYSKGWISTRDGNASFRRKDEPYFYVTPSGVRKQHMNSEMILKLDMNANRILDSYQEKIIGLNPTGELHLHLLLQKILPKNRVVLHLHPTHIISALYAGLDLQKLAQEFPEVNRYTKVGPTVPKLQPTSQVLAEATVQAFNLNFETGDIDFDIVGLDRHGVIAVGEDAWSAFEHIERLNSVCEMVLLAHTN